ncbi:hypothetical protein JZO66_03925 [Enterococcus sp. DIV0242_7C1]|uniref:LXG domain-containing protein n=1 Tax=Candidatus Enterococcus dunnyi TaxID=1834192 RepID=A0A200JCU0_9ENTE|nr:MULTISPECIES: hypothetical protein [unclassified Enterococcus]MBO0469682.1 hypothetical protein [Enterococcus sp. DIV0242_7C1]OUZ35026.1 hypothetical protein A5889_000501 [Enterococcus sp. 9D6_DIV0238]
MSFNFYLGEVTAQSAAAKQMANEYMQFCGTLKDCVNTFLCTQKEKVPAVQYNLESLELFLLYVVFH